MVEAGMRRENNFVQSHSYVVYYTYWGILLVWVAQALQSSFVLFYLDMWHTPDLERVSADISRITLWILLIFL